MQNTTQINSKQGVSAVSWDWREREDNCRSRAFSRRRGLIQGLCMIVLGGLLYGVFGHRPVAYFIWGISFLLLLGALCVPALLKGFERLGAGLALVIGTGMTYLLLTPMYFLVFMPGRFFMALAGRDPLQLKIDKQSATYWDDRQQVTSPEYYSRQY